MKKEIRFSSSIDTKDFDRAIEGMQRKLQQIYQGSDTSKMMLETRSMAARQGIGREPTQAEKGRSYQEDMRVRRELGRFIKDELKTQEDLVKKIEQQKKLVKELENAYKNMATSAQAVNDAKKTALTLEEKLRASVSATQEAIQRRQMPGYGGVGGWGGVLERGAGQYAAARAGGAGMLGAAGRGAGGLLAGASELAKANPLLFAAGSIGAIVAGSKAAQGVGEYIIQTPARALEAQASAAQASSMAMKDIFADKTYERFLYRQEEEQARKMAAEQFASEERFYKETQSPFDLLSSGLPRTRYLGRLGIGEYQKEYEDIRSSQEAQRAEELRQDLIKKDPKKLLTFQRVAQEAPQNLAIQRGLGLSDQDLYSIYSGAGGMFTMEQQRGAMGRILGAGGSTRAARGLGTFSNQLMRDQDITNAPELIAALSRASGSASSSENSMRKLLSESVRVGLDDSEFREEQRQFLTVSSEVIARSGARSDQSQGMIAERFSQFLAERTMAGIAGAKSAYEMTQQMSSETSGARGVMQAAEFLGPGFKGLSERAISALMNLREEEIAPDNDLVQAAYRQRKKENPDLTIEQFVESVRESKARAKFPESAILKSRSELRDMAKGKTYQELQSDPQFMEKLQDFQVQISPFVDFKGKGQQFLRSFALGDLGISAPGGKGEALGMPGAPTRAADIVDVMNAIGQSSIIQDLQDFSRQLKMTTEDVKNYVARATRRARPEEQARFQSLTNLSVGPTGLETVPPIPQQQPNVESK